MNEIDEESLAAIENEC